jgi:hypothetical protein
LEIWPEINAGHGLARQLFICNINRVILSGYCRFLSNLKSAFAFPLALNDWLQAFCCHRSLLWEIFSNHYAISANGGPVDHVGAWLEHESQSKQWLDYVEKSRQGELF